MAFVSDTLESGRKFRVFNVVDDYSRMAIEQELSMSMPAERVIRILEKTIWINGKPDNIGCDNGQEFILYLENFKNGAKLMKSIFYIYNRAVRHKTVI